MSDHLLITNCTILAQPGDQSLIDSGFIEIAGPLITRVGPMADCPPARGKVLDGQGQLAMPGLVNGHCHAAMTLFRGLADDLTLADWLHPHIFPAEARLVSPEMVYWCTRLAAAEMLLGGVTTVADGYFFEDEAARAFAEAGLRCVAAQAVIDFPTPDLPDPGRAIEHAAAFLDRWHGCDPLVTPAVFAHAPYTCANDTLIRAKALAREHGTILFLHAAETRNEISQIAQPLADTPIRHLDRLGLLDQDTVLIHCVWVDDRDIDLLAERQPGVIICPQSHCKLASGMAPLTAMATRGVRLGLGSDGAASNNSLDLFREMDLTAKVQKAQTMDPVATPARRILERATRGGAGVLGLPSLGRIAPGYAADLILLDLRQRHLQPLYGPDTLVYSGGAADVHTVLVAGRLVVRDRQLLTLDLRETMERVRLLAATVR